MKKLYSLLFILFLFVFMPSITNANGLYEGATDLQRNDSTNYFIDEKNDLTTITGEDDSRIYKISLGMNASEKLTLVSRKTFDVEITGPNGNTIVQRTGVGDEGYRQVEFETSYVGDYYIQINPSNDGRSDYPYSLRVIAGEPVVNAILNRKNINILLQFLMTAMK